MCKAYIFYNLKIKYVNNYLILLEGILIKIYILFNNLFYILNMVKGEGSPECG